jgi:glycosyltransferase involved in cell wall biosynthesis
MNCYNCDKYLKEAIDSVLAQTYTNWEIIFWDNQSTDKSADIVKSYNDKRIKYFYAEQHTTLGEARNFALSKVNGEYIAFLDCDDIWTKNKLTLQVNLMDSNPSIGLCYGNYQILDEKNSSTELIVHKYSKLSKINIIKNYNIGMLTVMIRANILDLLQGDLFDTKLKLVEEYDLFCRIIKNSDLIYCDDLLGYYRWHGNNSSNKYIQEWSSEYKYLAEKYKKLEFTHDEITYLSNLSIFTNIKYLMISNQFKLAKESNQRFKPLSAKQFILKFLLSMPIFLIILLKPLWMRWTRF